MMALALASALAAGACGGNDDKAAAGAETKSAPETKSADQAKDDTGSAEFCASAKSLYDQLTSTTASDPTSPEVQAVFAEAKALDAPAEIAADWAAILDTLVEPVVTGELDVNDPATANELATRAGTLGDALQRTGAYFETECKFG